MPIYSWVDKKTKKEVEIVRSFSLYQDEPSKDEAIGEGLTEDEFDAAEWEKVIGKDIRVIPGESWGPGKGHW